MGLYEIYFKFQRESEEKYGSNTVVLLQKGKFYEIYQLKTENRKIGKTFLIAEMIDIKVSLTNGSKPHSDDNPYMAGIPINSFEDYTEKILAYNFTVVKVDQIEQKTSNGNITREVSSVISPGTSPESNQMDLVIQSNILSLYLEIEENKETLKPEYKIGVSLIDTSTGQNWIFELVPDKTDEDYVFKEITRIILGYQPREVLIHIKSKLSIENIEKRVNLIRSRLDIDDKYLVLIKINQLDKSMYKKDYQNNFLKKAFFPNRNIIDSNKIVGNINAIEELKLENFNQGIISYLILLQYCYEHDETLIKRISRPILDLIDANKYLILTDNAISQLDIFSKKELYRRIIHKKFKLSSLIDVINGTQTPMGYRKLKKALITPYTSIKFIQILYDLTEIFLNKSDESYIYEYYRSELRKLPDIELLHRKLFRKSISPVELSKLFESYKIVQNILSKIDFDSENYELLNGLKLSPEYYRELNKLLEKVQEELDLDILEDAKIIRNISKKNSSERIEIHRSYLKSSFDSEIDDIQEKIDNAYQELNEITDKLNQYLEFKTKSKSKIKYTNERNKEGIVSIKFPVNNKIIHLLKNCNSVPDLSFELVDKVHLIISPRITENTNLIAHLQSELEFKLYLKYQSLLDELTIYQFYENLTIKIGSLDYICSNAYIARINNYFKPTLIDNKDYSCLEVKELRHPLIEKLIDKPYVSNDITFLESRGMILYGINSTGKTSLTKSLGLVIIMAQAGMYVPGKLSYHPYRKIITRLSGHDDLFKAQSSFVVEAMEIRTIQRYADSYTLVLGDELCRGTDSISGTAIVSATIKLLIERKSSFITSSHMHHLPNLKYIKSLEEEGKLQISHLYAKYDEKIDELIYERKIRDGPGESIYGLEVCKSLHFDREFLENASKIRKELENQPLLFYNNKTSHYNSSLFMDECSICGKSNNLQTHHIREQSEADENGYIGHMHKDIKSNLISLCQECHHKVHKEKYKIETKETLNGISYSLSK